MILWTQMGMAWNTLKKRSRRHPSPYFAMEKDASGSFPSSRANLSLFSAKEPEASFRNGEGRLRLLPLKPGEPFPILRKGAGGILLLNGGRQPLLAMCGESIVFRILIRFAKPAGGAALR